MGLETRKVKGETGRKGVRERKQGQMGEKGGGTQQGREGRGGDQ